MENIEENKVEEQKHTELKEGDGTAEPQSQEVIVSKNKFIANIASPFLKQKLSWENDEAKFDVKIPDDIKRNIEDELKFLKPSVIQSIAIPMINTTGEKGCYEDLIAQAKNGSGKTGAFAIGSILRLDRALQKTQILVIVNTRELCNQIAAVYELLIKGTDITLCNYAIKVIDNPQIIISTHGKIQDMISGRKKIPLKDLKCLIVDEADAFFYDDKTFNALKAVCNYPDIKNREGVNRVQKILFSATFVSQDEATTEAIQRKQAEIVAVDGAQQIEIKPEKLQLGHIKQCFMKCEPKKKLDFIKEIFEACEMTQTYIFVNTKDFAETVHTELNKAGLKSYIMFSKMTKEERDQTMQQFREQKINVLIATDLISRGVDVPEAELVINYDVPTHKVKGQVQANSATYLHRIGRVGRFGRQALALSIYDRDQDKQFLDDIIDHYKFDKSKTVELQGADHLKQLLREIDQD